MKILKPFFYCLLVILCSGEFSPLSSIENNTLNTQTQKSETIKTVPHEGITEGMDHTATFKSPVSIRIAQITNPSSTPGITEKTAPFKSMAPLNSLSISDTFGYEASSMALEQTDIADAHDQEIALSYPELHFSNNLSPDLVHFICEGDAKGTLKHGKAYLSSNEIGKVTLLSKATVEGVQGQNASCIIAASFGRGNTGTQQLFGMGNETDGLFFKLIDSTFVILYRTNHEEVIISQSNWSIDPMDGTGLSDVIFDYTKNHIFKIQSDLDFSKINFYIESSLTGKFVLVHQVDSSSGYPTRSLENLSLQLMAQVVNGPSQLKVSSMNLFVDGHSVFSNVKNHLDICDSNASDLNME